MRNFLEILVRIWIVGGYYLVVCPILYLILLVMHPFNKNKLTYKNVFDSDFITPDPDEIEYLNSGDKYYSYRTAWDFLIDRKTWFVK